MITLAHEFIARSVLAPSPLPRRSRLATPVNPHAGARRTPGRRHRRRDEYAIARRQRRRVAGRGRQSERRRARERRFQQYGLRRHELGRHERHRRRRRRHDVDGLRHAARLVRLAARHLPGQKLHRPEQRLGFGCESDRLVRRHEHADHRTDREQQHVGRTGVVSVGLRRLELQALDRRQQSAEARQLAHHDPDELVGERGLGERHLQRRLRRLVQHQRERRYRRRPRAAI